MDILLREGLMLTAQHIAKKGAQSAAKKTAGKIATKAITLTVASTTGKSIGKAIADNSIIHVSDSTNNAENIAARKDIIENYNTNIYNTNTIRFK
jgi:hypothetical protein